jgi:hypothetical protein
LSSVLTVDKDCARKLRQSSNGAVIAALERRNKEAGVLCAQDHHIEVGRMIADNQERSFLLQEFGATEEPNFNV